MIFYLYMKCTNTLSSVCLLNYCTDEMLAFFEEINSQPTDSFESVGCVVMSILTPYSQSLLLGCGYRSSFLSKAFDFRI